MMHTLPVGTFQYTQGLKISAILPCCNIVVTYNRVGFLRDILKRCPGDSLRGIQK